MPALLLLSALVSQFNETIEILKHEKEITYLRVIYSAFNRHVANGTIISWYCYVDHKFRFHCWLVETGEHLSGSDWFHMGGC